MDFEEFETAGVYSEKFAKYVDNFVKTRDSFTEYSKTISNLIGTKTSYSEIQKELRTMNIQPPTIPKNIEDEEIQTHESLLKIMETYKSTIEAKDKLNNEINEKSELVSKMCEIFNISKRIIKNEENMNDIQKVIYNLETEVSEKKVEVDNLEKKSKELRWLIINNEKKIYEYTIDNMKLFTNFLKIKEGTTYNENKLVEAVNKMITTPMELLFKKPDLSVCGYNTENYAVYDNDEPVNTDNTKLSEVLIPFNNNSRTFLLKTNDLRDMAAIKNGCSFGDFAEI